MKALLIDVGNTRLKWGIASDGAIGRTGHITQTALNETSWQALTTKLPRRVDAVAVSNVASNAFATRLAAVLGIHCSCDVQFARSERAGWGLTNGYSQPRLLGVDRWVAMIGAWRLIDGACLVVDAGTAITIDAIDSTGQHLGGQILPGSDLMLASLSDNTSNIPKVSNTHRKTDDAMAIFGKSTSAAVREGVTASAVGAVERAAKVLQDAGHDPKVVLTGGGSARILDALTEEPLHRPHLVLEGLLHRLEHAK